MIEQLVEKIVKANEAYRLGNPTMSDIQYDILVDELRNLDPDNDILNLVGIKVTDESRKRRLPIPMASMNKTKFIHEILNWCRVKGIDTNEDVILSPKFDGLSLCVNELTDEASTRGDGTYGQRSDEHYKLIGNKLMKLPAPWPASGSFEYTFGEVMMPKKVFIDKYSKDFANPRNFVGGLLNSKEVTQPLSDCIYIKYGASILPEFQENFKTKKSILDELNNGQDIQVQYKVLPIKDLTEDLLLELFKKWSIDLEIDGVIIEINSLELQERLGRETSSNNPVWARAFKSPNFEQTAETEILKITWNISKQGYLKPIINIKPVRLDGVTISNVTGNNARFVKDMGLGIGAKVLIKRSGMVIPIINEVLLPVDFVMPEFDNIGWNENGVELITLSETDDQRFKQLVSFFEILEAENFGEGVIKQLWDCGHKTVKDITSLSISDLESIDRFGKRKASIVHTSIKKCLENVTLSKLQHATGLFGNGLGSRKLALLEHFTTKPSINQVLEIDGFADVSANAYINNYDRFFDFIKDLPITFKKQEESIKVGNDLDNTNFVFTGVRRADLEKIIESRGGKIGSSVSKNTSHLIMKEMGSGSSKEKKATELGVKIMTVDQLEEMLKNN